ncbi:LlaJI family restriction endonuclease [Alkanindiges illinoisensis]|uniref:LlaJI family restriction endonuclease n=1 Tax=Alkanindiges illinoisensis TaxID=197183 RepID=UPI00047C92E4|nr:LlaJI family restriction endonuclease [Alkanindiges illinoisensis]
MSEFYFYNDRMAVTALPENLRTYITSAGLVTNDSEQRVSFCGLVIHEHNLNIFLPRSSTMTGATLGRKQQLASRLMQTIDRYGRSSSTAIKTTDEGEGRQGLTQLGLIISLLDDYRNNGLYSRRQTLNTTNSGRIDWPKTINKNLPYPDHNNNPVYLNLHGRHSRYLSNTEVSRIHAAIIRQTAKKYGWIINEYVPLLEAELNNVPQPAGNQKYQLALLRQELSLTYSERDILLLRQLIKYLEAQHGSNPSHFIAGLTRFHHAWEYMLGQVLHGIININSQLPIPVYIHEDGHVENAAGMRTDIVLKDPENKCLTVIDAKYYTATNVGNSPGWGDIVKQLFYAKALENVCSKKEKYQMKNIFIFPGHKPAFRQIRMRSRQEGLSYLDDQFLPITCLYACPLKIIDLFSTRQKILLSELTNP